MSMNTPALSLHVAEAAGQTLTLTGQTQTPHTLTELRMLTHQALPSGLWAGPPSLTAVLVEAVAEPP